MHVGVFTCLCLCVPQACLVPVGAPRVCPWNWSHRQSRGAMCWESNPVPLEEQPVLLTVEASLQPLKHTLLNEMDMYTFFFLKHETFILDLERIKSLTGGLRGQGVAKNMGNNA